MDDEEMEEVEVVLDNWSDDDGWWLFNSSSFFFFLFIVGGVPGLVDSTLSKSYPNIIIINVISINKTQKKTKTWELKWEEVEEEEEGGSLFFSNWDWNSSDKWMSQYWYNPFPLPVFVLFSESHKRDNPNSHILNSILDSQVKIKSREFVFIKMISSSAWVKLVNSIYSHDEWEEWLEHDKYKMRWIRGGQ